MKGPEAGSVVPGGLRQLPSRPKEVRVNGRLIENVRMLTWYNSLANRGLYEACALLPDAELKAPRPAFPAASTAPHHLMVTDRIYLARFAGEEVPSTNSTRSSAKSSRSS